MHLHGWLLTLLGPDGHPSELTALQVVLRTVIIYLIGLLLVRACRDFRLLGRQAVFDVMLSIIDGEGSGTRSVPPMRTEIAKLELRATRQRTTELDSTVRVPGSCPRGAKLQLRRRRGCVGCTPCAGVDGEGSGTRSVPPTRTEIAKLELRATREEAPYRGFALARRSPHRF